jgi:hypothetical protein
MSVPSLPETVAWLVAGAALGAVYLFLIGRTIAAMAPPAARVSAAAWLVLRLALAACLFWLAAQRGAAPLVLLLAGFLLARTVALRRIGGR